jgi:hypothetical protein
MPPPFEDERVDAGAPLISSVSSALRRARAPRCGYLDALSAYRVSADAFAGDVAAGIVVAVMLVPQAMAYAQLSGMPPVTGFYAAILALFVYPVRRC